MKRFAVNHTVRAFQCAGRNFRHWRFDVLRCHLIAAAGKHIVYAVFLLRIIDEHTVRLDNMAFIRSNFLYRIAEHRHVIQRNVRHHGNFRCIYDICRVIPSAETDFQHDNITRLLCKILHRTRGCELKFPDVLAFRQNQLLLFFRDLRRNAAQVFARNHLFIDADALTEIHDKRRGVQTGFVSGLL